MNWTKEAVNENNSHNADFFSLQALALDATGWEPESASATFYESSINGSWSGWGGETIVTLTNGQTWQQSTYHYEYDYAYNPTVIVYQSGNTWKMWVEGIEEPVDVTRLK